MAKNQHFQFIKIGCKITKTYLYNHSILDTNILMKLSNSISVRGI